MPFYIERNVYISIKREPLKSINAVGTLFIQLRVGLVHPCLNMHAQVIQQLSIA